MYWLAFKAAVVLTPKCRCFPILSHRQFCRVLPSSPQIIFKQSEETCSVKARKLHTCAGKKHLVSKVSLDDKDYAHVIWWKERLQACRKPSSLLLATRLTFSNLLGVDTSLKNGNLKEGTLNWEMLQFKSKFPREVLLCRVGEFYESIGADACILVEYAGLNPFGGLRSDSIPRAGCPVVNLRQTLDDLTRNGFSVCIVEEVQGPTQVRTRKTRFISGVGMMRLIRVATGKGTKATLLRMAMAETVYAAWKIRNEMLFAGLRSGPPTGTIIINLIAARCQGNAWFNMYKPWIDRCFYFVLFVCWLVTLLIWNFDRPFVLHCLETRKYALDSKQQERQQR